MILCLYPALHTSVLPAGSQVTPELIAAIINYGFTPFTELLTGAPVQELAYVGIFEYQNVFTSHHKLVYRRINDDVYVYAMAGHRQDYPTLLMNRLLKP